VIKESPLRNVRQFAYFVDGDISHALGRREFEGGIQERFSNEERSFFSCKRFLL